MSVVLLEEYKSVKTTNDRREVLRERTRILETVSRKAQEKTLTLQETTDLYAKFNSTYELNYGSKVKRNDDESWALKLIQECEDDASKTASFETRINGVPLTPNAAKAPKAKPNLSEIRAINQNNSTIDKPKLIEEKVRLRDSFIYDQFSLNQIEKDAQLAKKSHHSLIIVMAISVFVTATALIGGAIFL
jgi:hypothetical protein